MPRFFFDVNNGRGITTDDEGIDLQDQAAAERMALDSIRSIIAEEARKGVIDFDGYIDVRDDQGRDLLRIAFLEAFTLNFADVEKEE